MKRLINFSKNIILSNFKRGSYPYKLTFVLTYKCNSRCKICQIWKRKIQRELVLNDIANFFKKNNYFTWIDLTGGEVFLREDLLDVIKIILRTQKNLYLLHIPSNGLLTEKIVTDIKSILKLKPNRLLISIALDGPEKVHDSLRGVGGSFKKSVSTFKKLKKLKSSRFDCFFGMTLSQFNFELIEETYKSLKEKISFLERSDIHFNIAHHSSLYYQNKKIDLGLKDEIGKELEKFTSKRRQVVSGVYFLEKVYQNLIPVYLKDRKTPLSCQALSSSVFVDPYGEVFPCGMWQKPLGNLKDYNWQLQNLWFNKKLGPILKEIRFKNCSNCWTPCEAYQSILGSLIKSAASFFSKDKGKSRQE